MSDESEAIVELLHEILGDDKQHYESKGQISFDCPVCASEKGLENGDGKATTSEGSISVGLVVRPMVHKDPSVD